MLTIIYDRDGISYSDFDLERYIVEVGREAKEENGGITIHTSTFNVINAARVLSLEYGFTIRFKIGDKFITPNEYGAILHWPSELDNVNDEWIQRILTFAMEKKREEKSIKDNIFEAIDKWIDKPENEIINLLVNEPEITDKRHAGEWLNKYKRRREYERAIAKKREITRKAKNQ